MAAVGGRDQAAARISGLPAVYLAGRFPGPCGDPWHSNGPTCPGRERDLLTSAAQAAAECADPGLLFTDMLIAARLPYDSDQGRQLAPAAPM
jgi:hypothetical protein